MFLDEKSPNDNDNVVIIIVISVISAVISILSIILIHICYRRKRNKRETEPSIVNDIRDTHLYEETEYAKVDENPCSKPTNIQEYQDLTKPLVHQISQTSSVKSNTYQDLVQTNEPNSPTEMYTYIESPSHLLPGTSFNLFKKSLENLIQDSSKVNKDNYQIVLVLSRDDLF